MTVSAPTRFSPGTARFERNQGILTFARVELLHPSPRGAFRRRFAVEYMQEMPTASSLRCKILSMRVNWEKMSRDDPLQ